MGSEDSPSRLALLDAVEKVMVEEGYAAVTSRRVAERAGLKQQLVYYYFRTMDDLVLAAYRRHTERMLDRFEKVLASPRPLHAYWEVSTDPVGATLSMEYMALANHNEIIRKETREFGERLRRLQARVIGSPLRKTVPIRLDACPPVVITTALNSIAQVLVMEAAFGMSYGRAETSAFVNSLLRQAEPDDPGSGRRPRAGRKARK